MKKALSIQLHINRIQLSRQELVLNQNSFSYLIRVQITPLYFAQTFFFYVEVSF